MQPKIKERTTARKLRAKGLSLTEIAAKVRVSKSSVSLWTQDVPLSTEAKARIHDLGIKGRERAAITNRIRNGDRRVVYRQAGRAQAKKNNPLHIKGCMLYWAEGTKSGNSVHFCNSDPAMMQLFVGFLVRFFAIDRSKVRIRVYCYDDVKSVSTILSYWKNVVGLPGAKMNHPVVNRYPSISKGKRVGKLPFGTCHIRISNVGILQHIYGALEVYGDVFYHPAKT